MPISSPGIGSSLDVNGIVRQLMAIEQRPLNALRTRESGYNAQVSAYGTLKSALAGLQTVSQSLSTADKWHIATASVADASVLTASAGTQAVPGSYLVEVTQLAQQQKINSPGFSSTADLIGSGTLTIQFGTYDSGTNSFSPNAAKPAQTVTINPSDNTLAGVRNAINAANVGITATIINDGTTNRIVVTSNDSGLANSLKITVADADGNNTDTAGLSQLAFDPTAAAGSGKNLTQLSAAQNAQLKIDGIAVTKASNTISDAIEGVTLNLLTTNAGTTAALIVQHDSAGIKSSVAAFVKSYNDLNKSLHDLTAYNATTKQGAVLQGDSTTRLIQSRLRTTLTTAISVPSGGIATLSQIGLSFQNDGSLAVDDAKLQNAINNNFTGMVGIFAGSGGYANTVDKLVGGFLGTDGAITSRTDGINASIKDLGVREDALTRRLASIEARYRAQFTALDTMISGMTATSNFLTQQLANLPKINGVSNNN